MGRLLCPSLETCYACGKRSYHILMDVDIVDDYIELECISCRAVIILSYQVVPQTIVRVWQRAYPPKEEAK